MVEQGEGDSHPGEALFGDLWGERSHKLYNELVGQPGQHELVLLALVLQREERHGILSATVDLEAF